MTRWGTGSCSQQSQGAFLDTDHCGGLTNNAFAVARMAQGAVRDYILGNTFIRKLKMIDVSVQTDVRSKPVLPLTTALARSISPSPIVTPR